MRDASRSYEERGERGKDDQRSEEERQQATGDAFELI